MLFVDEAWQLPHHLFDKVASLAPIVVGVGDVGQLPPIEIGTWCTPSQMLAIAPNAPVMSLLAISNSSSVTAAMTINATRAGPNATRNRSRA